MSTKATSLSHRRLIGSRRTRWADPCSSLTAVGCADTPARSFIFDIGEDDQAAGVNSRLMAFSRKRVRSPAAILDKLSEERAKLVDRARAADEVIAGKSRRSFPPRISCRLAAER